MEIKMLNTYLGTPSPEIQISRVCSTLSALFVLRRESEK